MNSKYSRFLIIRTDRIGDVILTLPMAKVLKHRFPSAHVAMLIRRYTTELAEDNEHIDQILYYDRDDGSLVPFSGIVATLKKQKYDVVIHTQPRPRLALITRFASIPVRIGTGYRWYSMLFNKRIYEHRKTAERHELEYNLNLLSAIGVSYEGISVEPKLKVRPDVLRSVESHLRSAGVREHDSLVILHPGSGGSARDWSPQKFGELAHLLGNISSVRVVITGKKEEEQLVNTVLKYADSNAIPLVGFGALREFAALASLAKVFVANSTGPIHAAAAVETPVIGLYPQLTALNATRWGPYTTKKTIFSPQNKAVDCTLCRAKHSTPCECMETISVHDVYRAVLQYVGIQ